MKIWWKNEYNYCVKNGHVLNFFLFFFRKLFAGLRSLMVLSMNNNNLKTIDTRAFKFTQKLFLIVLSNNELTLQSTPRSISSSISSPFHTCTELRRLHLSHNNVSNIFEDWKTSLNLKVLDLSHNQLQVLRVIVGS